MTSPIFNLSGPASGIDINALIDAIIERKAIPKRQIERRLEQSNARLGAVGELRTKLAAVRTKAEALRNVALFPAAAPVTPGTLGATITPPVGGSAGFTASVVGAGTAGTYNVEVLATAQAARLQSGTFANAAAALGYSGTMTINGQNVTVVAGDSLNSLATKINTALGATATAAVETVAPGQFRLTVTSSTIGLGSNFTVTSTGNAPGVLLGFQSTVYTQARAVESNAIYRNEAGVAATAATRIVNLRSNANVNLGYVAGDVLTVQVRTKDGTLETRNLTVTATTTVQDVLGLMSGAATGTTNSVVGGRLRLTSNTLGPNSLEIVSLFAEKSADPTGRVAVAGTAVSNTGPTALAQAGQNATVRINGVNYSAATNTGLTFAALPDLTLNLTAASVGGASQLVVSAGSTGGGGDNALAATRTALQELVTAYNDLRTFMKEQGTPSGETDADRPALYNDPILRTIRGLVASPFLVANPLADPAYNRLSTIGIQLSRDGTLIFDSAKFDAAYTANRTAVETLVRQVSTATGSNLSIVAAGAAAQPGNYSVDVTAVATQAAIAGVGFGGVYGGGGPPDLLRIVDRRTGSEVEVLITDGMTTAQIAAAINAAAASAVSEVRQASVALEANGGGPATAGTTLANLRGPGGTLVNVGNGDRIDFSGRRADGSAFAGSFLVTNTATQTLGDLQGALQASLGPSATVSLVNGAFQVTTPGGGTTTLTLASDNLAGGSLTFGTFAVQTAGRPPVDITATDVGGQLTLRTGAYGSAAGLELQFTDEGGAGPEQLGFTNGQTAFGTDIQGTIGGVVATGFGQQLTASPGSPSEGLIVRYDGVATGVVGSVGLSVGFAAGLQRLTNDWLRSVTGLLDTRVSRLDADNTAFQRRIDAIDTRLAARRAALLQSFTKMEEALARFQNTGNYLNGFLQSLQPREQR